MSLPHAPLELQLRPVRDADLEAFYAHQCDPVAHRMAAFGAHDPCDRAAFDAHWARIRADPGVVIRTVVVDWQGIGHVLSFGPADLREVSYWIARTHWGRGVATLALTQFLAQQPARPLFARAAKDNAGSIGVLRHCGFVVCGEERSFAPVRLALIDELILRLDR
ncbi:MAG: GNAT family N-acetyltransferase [Burkholderiaceae bacterium]